MTEGLPAGYVPTAGVFDEMLCADGTLRDTWERVLATPDFRSAEVLENRWREAERQIRENGVTYNVYGDPRGLARPWPLDPVPLVIEASEWQAIEAGLIQRARLMSYVVGDIYGGQSLFHSGSVAPGAVLSNPGFLRPCHGIVPPDNTHLHFIAVDIGRQPDGAWAVLNDRTQAPSGAGYALENRIVTSRCLSESFNAQPVHRLAGFFRALRDNINNAASLAARRSRGSGAEPQVVLLTPGPYNETYFEHAYLARYLGYPLVAGEDLTVRYDRVYLKTLSGLQPVDGILRRLDDDYCDPLWLKAGSALGIPGLVAAHRRGHVAVCNRLGSGIVEAPAMLGYLPRINREIFAEDLILPQAESHWLGDTDNLHDVMGRLREYVIKPAFRSFPFEPVFCDTLDDESLEALEARVRKRPHAFVAQRRMNLSCVPVWQDGRLVARPMVVRTYIAASGSGWVVMPGGLTRVARRSGDPVVSLQAGGGSKDTWILASAPVEIETLWPSQSEAIALRRTATVDLPSRVADNLFWLGRYVERTEVMLRLARATMNRYMPDAALGASAIPSLLRCLNRFGIRPAQPARLSHLLTAFDEGLPPVFKALHHSATTVRDRLSMDAWRLLNPLGMPTGLSNRAPVASAAELEGYLMRIATFNGLAMENMTRGLGWRFLELGRRIERAIQTAGAVRILGSESGETEPAAFEALLEVCDSTMTYRSRYYTSLRLDGVLDLVISDDSNPRAIAFQLTAINEHLRYLPRERPGTLATPEHRMAAACLAELRRVDMRRLADSSDASGELTRPALDRFAANLSHDLSALSDVLGEAYFKHAIPALVAHTPAMIPARG